MATPTTPEPIAVAIANLYNTIQAAGTLDGAPDYVLAPIVNACIATQNLITSTIATTDAGIGNGSGLAAGPGLDAGATAASAVAYLAAQLAATQTQYNLLTLQSYVQRIELNIASRL